MHKIACFGDNCIDYYDKLGISYFGGNPLNVAVYTKRLGYDSSYIGAVGTDVFGKQMLKAIEDKGVDVSHIHVDEGKNALTHVEIVNDDRVFGEYEEGVMADFSLNERDIKFIAEHDIAVTGIWGKCEEQLSLLKDRGVKICFDSTDRPADLLAVKAYPYIDIFFFSDDTSDNPTLEKRLVDIYEKSPKLVVATRGANGSVAYDGKTFTYQDIVKVNVVDTLGAGDSFIAGFLNAYLENESIKTCMASGAACSSETIQYRGTW